MPHIALNYTTKPEQLGGLEHGTHPVELAK